MPRKIDQFGRKRCQKKGKDVDYKPLLEFFQKYFVVQITKWTNIIQRKVKEDNAPKFP